MTGRGRFIMHACLAGALVTALPALAAGASAKHRKQARGKRAIPATVSPAAAPRDADEPRSPAGGDGGESGTASASERESAEPEPAPRRESARSPAAPSPSPRSDDEQSGAAAAPSVLLPSSRRGAQAAAGEARDDVAGAALSDDDARALGRREASRVAAGRIEVAVSAGIDAGRRVFTYSDPIGAAPQAYRLPLAPLATFRLEVYPLASTDVPVVRDLGLRARVSRGFAMESSTTNGVALQDSWTRFAGDVRQRVLLPGAHGVELGATVGIDASYFDLQTKSDVGSLVPAARMLSLRFGLDGRVPVTPRFSILAGGGYLATLSRGQIYDRFRRPHVAGVDGELGAALALAPGVEARLDGRYTRYFASFSPEVGDPAVAGGALDQQFQLGVGVRYAH